jgi:NitT/TauT family transport system substrate-binding protein
MKLKTASLAAALTLVAALAPVKAALAEAKELRLAQQFGIAYLPFVVMQKHALIEKHAAKNGIPEIKVNWLQFGGGSSMNDALISGNLDFAAAGIPVFLSLWNKTRGDNDVRVAAGLNKIPVLLNTNNPKVKSIKDFDEGDKIALPAVKVSLQAMILQMAAAKEWGQDSFSRLDKLTVSMKHPDAMVALISGKSEITGHFTSPPFMFQELEHPGIRTVLNSADVLGTHSFNVIYASIGFRQKNPTLYKSYLAALDEAMQMINADKRAAAKLYIESAPSAANQAELTYRIVSDPSVEFTTSPGGLLKFADFMTSIGTLTRKPSNDPMCFPEVDAKDCS